MSYINMIPNEYQIHDGDQVTTVSIKNAKYHALFLPMCQTYAFIDRATGNFNSAMDFKKDYSAIISMAWDIDTAYDMALKDPDAETFDMIHRLGLDEATTSEKKDRRNTLLRILVNTSSTSKLKDRYIDPFGWK